MPIVATHGLHSDCGLFDLFSMMSDAARRRIRAIHGHIAEGGQNTTPVLVAQVCRMLCCTSCSLRFKAQ